MVKRVLMVVFHFPPQRGSSGIQRTLKFVQYLPASGWQPLVLSAAPRAYPDSSPDQLGEIPAGTVVKRAFALDTARHLALRGRYAGLMALPDRWVSWCLGALPSGLRMVRQYQPAVLWSTYPIASAHLIGLVLRRLTGLPWIADLRDPMSDQGYPAAGMMRRAYQWIEAQTVRHCTRAVCTTPGAVRTYRQRFPDVPAERFCLIENGYDEINFTEAEAAVEAQAAAQGAPEQPFVLLHSGVIYPSERDPTALFGALSDLLAQRKLSAASFQLVLRAPGHEAYLQALINQHGIAAIASIAPALPYRAALAEMLAADGLLLLQAGNCNDQIPAKLYEYLRARRPLLALTDPAGDTAWALREAGIDTVGPLDARAPIAGALQRFLALARAQQAPLASLDACRGMTRAARATQLAALLDEVVADSARQAPMSSTAP